MARLMSDAEMRRRQKLQGKIGRTTSTMGLSALGVTGVAAIAAKKPGALKAVQKIPGLKAATPHGMENAAIKSGIVSGGIGGVGGFNQASIYSAESRKRKQVVPVKKDLGMEMGYYGEEGHPVELPEIKVPIEKAWAPAASNFDSERSRQKRNKTYEGASLVSAGGAGAYTAHQGSKAVKEAKKIKTKSMAEVHDRINSAGQPYKIALGSQAEKAVPLKALKATAQHGGKAALGAGAVGAAALTHRSLKRKQTTSWQPYGKRDSASAFGIDHA